MEYMKGGLLEYFGEASVNPKEAIVIGVDFGSTLRVGLRVKEEISGKICYSPLLVSCGSMCEDAVLYYGENGEIELGYRSLIKTGGKYFTNYKVLPSRAEEIYSDDGSKRINLLNPSCQELMGRTLAKLMEGVLNNNEFIAEGARDVYLFVGRPAGECWAKEDREYRKILMSYLQEISAAYSKQFHLVIIPESVAIMSVVLCDRPDLNTKTVAVIDGGRSSFDCTVVRDGKILCEYRRRIGTDMLDKNLLDLYVFGKKQIWTQDANGHVMSWSVRQTKRKAEYARRDENHRSIYSQSEGASLISVREAKERYYGPDGTAANPTVSYVLDRTIEAVEDSPGYYEEFARYSAPIKKFIDLAVNEMSVLVKASYPIGENDAEHCGEDYEYESFAAGVESFFEGAKAKWERAGKAPDVILITGGAFHMPFVRDLMHRVLEPDKNGMEIIDTTLQEAGKVTIEEGLAYMGYGNLESAWTHKKRMANAKMIHTISSMATEKIVGGAAREDTHRNYNRLIEYLSGQITVEDYIGE